jgi:hypothetical protein
MAWTAFALSVAGCTLALDTSHLAVPSAAIACSPTSSCVPGRTACCAASQGPSVFDECAPYDAATANSVCGDSDDASPFSAFAILCARPGDCPTGLCCFESSKVSGGIRRTVCAQSGVCALFAATVCEVDSDCPTGTSCVTGPSRGRFKTCA